MKSNERIDRNGAPIGKSYRYRTAWRGLARQHRPIREVRRDPVVTPDDQPSFEWRIEMNHPPGGFISFRSAGYVQTERKPAVMTDQQHLSQAER